MEDKQPPAAQPINLAPLRNIRYWGAATSAHQVEGKNHNQWSVWEFENANELARTAPERLGEWLPRWSEIEAEATQPDNYVSSVAVDFYNRYEEDFDIVEALNMNAFRFSIEWSRIEPEPGKWDYTEIEHYRKMLRSLRNRGIEPLVCLLHFTLPVWFFELGGFEKKKNISYFTRFCEKVATELRNELTYIYTMNEPNVHTAMTYFEGQWPGHRSLVDGVKHYFNLMKAHKEAYGAMKYVKRDFQIGMTQHVVHHYSEGWNPVSKAVAKLRSWTWNWLFLNRTAPYHDFVGINFYLSNRVQWWWVSNPDERRNDMGWDMQPYNLRHALRETYWRYKKPILISENGLADAADRDRQWWIFETLRGMSDALEKDQVQILGYGHWSLLDNFEWNSGFWPRFGLVSVDRATLQRTVRDSAKWFADVLAKIRGL